MIDGLLGLPRWAQGLIGAGLLIVAFLVWDWFDDRQAITAHNAKADAKAQATASAAATQASQAVNQTRNEVEQTNAQARDAAARSPDPLRAGLDRLRTETGPAHRPPAARADDLRR